MKKQPIIYFRDNNIRDVLDTAADQLRELRGSLDSTLKTIEGLMAGALQYDQRSAIISTELIAGMVEKSTDVLEHIVIDLMHSDDAPAVNAMTKASGWGKERIANVLARGQEYVEEPDAAA